MEHLLAPEGRDKFKIDKVFIEPSGIGKRFWLVDVTLPWIVNNRSNLSSMASGGLIRQGGRWAANLEADNWELTSSNNNDT